MSCILLWNDFVLIKIFIVQFKKKHKHTHKQLELRQTKIEALCLIKMLASVRFVFSLSKTIGVGVSEFGVNREPGLNEWYVFRRLMSCELFMVEICGSPYSCCCSTLH